MKRKLLNALGLLFGVGAGAGFLLLLAATKPEPRRKPATDSRPLVEVINLESQAFDAVVEGFGTVRPSETLSVVFEVGGEIVEAGAGLGEGALIEKDALLFRVDDAPFRAEIAGLEAQIASVEAQRAEAALQNEADKKFLAIEDAVLELARKDYRRKLDLARESQVSESELEAAEVRLKERELTSEKRRASLAGFGKRVAAFDAAKRALEASLEAPRIRLKKTEIRAPYRCRVLDLFVRASQVVQPGKEGMVVFPVGAPAEISVPIESRLLPALFDPDTLERGKPPWSQVELEAELSWDHFGRTQKARGRVSRFVARIDPATRTLTALVEVPGPEALAKEGGARGLLPGAFVRVKIHGRRFEKVLVLPERALEGPDAVLVVRDGALHRVRIEPLVILGDDVVLPADGGLAPGSRVVVTGISGAYEGAPVRIRGEEGSGP